VVGILFVVGVLLVAGDLLVVGGLLAVGHLVAALSAHDHVVYFSANLGQNCNNFHALQKMVIYVVVEGPS
jgi:hypothetical protein